MIGLESTFWVFLGILDLLLNLGDNLGLKPSAWSPRLRKLSILRNNQNVTYSCTCIMLSLVIMVLVLISTKGTAIVDTSDEKVPLLRHDDLVVPLEFRSDPNVYDLLHAYSKMIIFVIFLFSVFMHRHHQSKVMHLQVSM